MPPARTDGDRRALSDFADVIINDTDDGVNLVVDNRDKVAYVLQFNFTQSENLDMRVLHNTEVLDDMKCFLEIPAQTTWDLADFDVNSEEVTSLAVAYHCRCRIRNPITGEIEACPTARNQERDDIPEKRIPINASIDLVLKHGSGGYNGYIENRGAPANITLDFGTASNISVSPLSKGVAKSKPLVATTDVPTGRIEFVELCPVARGPVDVKFSVVQCTQAKSAALPATVEQLAKKASAASSAPPPPPPPQEENWDEVGGGEGGEDWEQHGGGEGDFGAGGGGGGGGGGDGGGDGEWEQLDGGEGSFGGGQGGGASRLAATGAGAGGGVPTAASTTTTKSTTSATPSSTVKTTSSTTSSTSRAPAVGDTFSAGQLSKAFKNVHRDFGQPGPHDNGADDSKWSVYKWVLKRWDEERIMRIKMEAEYKVRMEWYLKQWYQSVCNICRLLLAPGVPNVEYKAYRLHQSCYDNAAKCNMCNEILVGDYVIAKGKDGKPDTKLHTQCVDPYKMRTRPTCGTCNRQIMDAKWANVGGKSYHTACREAAAQK